jgi:hypothetical protein
VSKGSQPGNRAIVGNTRLAGLFRPTQVLPLEKRPPWTPSKPAHSEIFSAVYWARPWGLGLSGRVVASRR